MLSQKIQEKIVDILESDSYLIENRMKFLNSLNLPQLDVVRISNSQLNEFFGKALNVWNSTRGSKATVYKLWKILKSKHFGLVAEKLEAKFPNEFPSTSTLLQMDYDPEPVSFEVSKEVRNFTGRSTELELLQKRFLKKEDYVFTVTGMGGMGKSELVRRFSRHFHKEHQFTTIWLNGQNRETLDASVKRLAIQFPSTSAKDDRDAKTMRMETRFLTSVSRIPSKKKLIIIDNVDEVNDGADSLINAKHPEDDCVFLITSKNLKMLRVAGEIIKVDTFSDEEAHFLVSSSLKNENPEDVKDLCFVMQNFPLGLQQAIAYIREQKEISPEKKSYTIFNYIQRFETMKKEYLGYPLRCEHKYELTTLTTWQITLEKIREDDDVGELAIKILNYIAYFEPKRISKDFLQLFFKKGDPVEKAIQLIQTYSLVKAEDELVSIHRLLQQVIQLNTFDKGQEVQQLREMTHSVVSILEDGEDEIRRIQPKIIIDIEFGNDHFEGNRLLDCIRSEIGHLLSVWNHNCKYLELFTEFKTIPIKIIGVVYPLRTRRQIIDDVTYFTEKNSSLFKTTFGPNAEESLELESEVATGPEMSEIKLKTLDETYDRQSSILGDDNILNLKLLEKISYSIICKGCYSSNKRRYGKYLYDFLRLREKISGPGHESTFPVRWQLIEEQEGKDPELLAQLNKLVNDVPPQDKDNFLQKMNEYGDSLFQDKKMAKANYILELWLGFKGTEETEQVTEAKWRLSEIQYSVGDRESALQTLQQAMVGWENRKNQPKLFVEMRSECERGDRKVREGDLEVALRLYMRVNDYQRSQNYPLSLYDNWWRYETGQKRASVLIQLRRCKEALQILQGQVGWGWDLFVQSNHKLQIERKQLLKKAKEGLRLEREAAETEKLQKHSGLVAEKLEAECLNDFLSTATLIKMDYDPEPVSFEVSPEVGNFTGRSTEFELLRERFLENEEYVFTVTGMGGMGKSEFARRFSRHFYKEHQFTTIWLNGQSRETLDASVQRLANQFPSTSAKDDRDAKSMEAKFLTSVSRIPSKKKLIIIDNVDEVNDGADSLMNAKNPEDDCIFLITSRNLKMLRVAGEIIKVDTFPDEEAHFLVSSSLKNENPEDVKDLCFVMQNFPLGLQQAIAYIREQKEISPEKKSYTIFNYIQRFETMKKEYLGYPLRCEHKYELTTLTTWQITLEKIREDDDVGELAIKILNYIAYFEPKRISKDFLQLFFKKGDPVEKAIQLIQTYSLVKAEDELVSIHRLLQQVIQLNTFDKGQEVQQLREMTHSVVSILEDGEDEIRRIQPKIIIDIEFGNDHFEGNRLLDCIRSEIGHLLSVWNHNCKYLELFTEFKTIPIKIIGVVYPLRTRRQIIDDVTYFTEKNSSLFKTTFGPNAEESLELESEVATGPEMSEIKLKTLDETYDRQSSILGDDNILNLKLLEKISYSIICKGCYSSNKRRYGKYLYDFLRLREKISGPGHESTFPVRWQLIEEQEGKDPELLAQLNKLVNDVPPQDKDNFLQKMNEYGDSLFQDKKMAKANYILELWLGFKGTEETEQVTEAKWRLSEIQYSVGDRESALQTLQQAMVGWENRKNQPKLFVEMRSECERGDRKVREGDLEVALRLYMRVNDYQRSQNYPLSLYDNWWRYETGQKRASVLIQLRRCKEALQILQGQVGWGWDLFVQSNHKLQIERKQLLKKAKEGLRLEREAAETEKLQKHSGLVAEKLEAECLNDFLSTATLIKMDYDPEPVSFEVSPEVGNFTGRSTEFELLRERFLENEEYVFTVTGMGGMGKSEFARRFSRHFYKEHQFTTIWLNGQSRETLDASVQRLANQFPSTSAKDDRDAKSMEAKFLTSVSRIPSKKKLIIIDNVDEVNDGADSLMNAKNPEDDCIFLITSRNLKMLRVAGEIIKVDTFPDEEAHFLVSSSLKNENPEDVKDLCFVMQNFPLGLQQAIAYIREQKEISPEKKSYTIFNYIQRFETMKKEYLGYPLRCEHKYELTTLTTWQITLEKIREDDDVGELAIKILNYIAYFEPKRISKDFLQLFFKKGDPVEKAIQLIQTYSLVKAEDELVSIHRLLQQVIQLNTFDKGLEVQQLREMTHSVDSIFEDGVNESQRTQFKFFFFGFEEVYYDSDCVSDNSYGDLKRFERRRKVIDNLIDQRPLLKRIRSGIRHLLSVWNHNCKYVELVTEFKRLPIKIIDVVYPIQENRKLIDDVTHFTKTCYSIFKKTFGPNAIETLELESEVAFSAGPTLSEINLNELDAICSRTTSILGEDNSLNLKLLEKISYSIICEGCYSDNKIRYGKYLKEFLRLREKISGRGHESTLPVQWELIEEQDAKDPELLTQLNELVNEELPPQHKEHFLQKMTEYGESLFKDKKYGKANYIYEAWLHIEGTEETLQVTWTKCELSFIQYILCDRESALQTLLQAVVEWEDRKNQPKLFVEIKSACERGDRKVREGDLHHALRLYTRVTDYLKSMNFPFRLYSNWWRYETRQKRASVLIKLRRYKKALHILENKVRWDLFVKSDHKLVIERKKLLKEAEEGLRLECECVVS